MLALIEDRQSRHTRLVYKSVVAIAVHISISKSAAAIMSAGKDRNDTLRPFPLSSFPRSHSMHSSLEPELP